MQLEQSRDPYASGRASCKPATCLALEAFLVLLCIVNGRQLDVEDHSTLDGLGRIGQHTRIGCGVDKALNAIEGEGDAWDESKGLALC